MTERTYGGRTAEQIKAAAQAATPGPWRVVTTTFHSCVASEHGMVIGAFGMANYGEDPVNGTFIAASNPAAVLEMLARIAELEEALQEIADYAAIDDADEAIALLEEAVSIAKAALEEATDAK